MNIYLIQKRQTQHLFQQDPGTIVGHDGIPKEYSSQVLWAIGEYSSQVLQSFQNIVIFLNLGCRILFKYEESPTFSFQSRHGVLLKYEKSRFQHFHF